MNKNIIAESDILIRDLYERFNDVDSDIKIPLYNLIEREDCINVKYRIVFLIELINRVNKSWLDIKINEFLKNAKKQTKENFSGLLGEIIAYGELLDTFKPNNVISQKNGSDFEVKLGNEFIKVEVNTPQKTSSPYKNTKFEISNKKEYINNGKKLICMPITVEAPFGYPTKIESNIQYEATSKFANIKKDKENKQFTDSNVSILWLDLNDPTIFPFNLSDQCQPIMVFRGAVSSGPIWYAFYGNIGDYIYSSYEGFNNNGAVKMEFNGRFNQNTKIDFLIINAFTKKCIFQNPNSQKAFSKELCKYFLNLFGLRLNASFIDFDKNRLKATIKNIRELNNQYYSLFKLS